MLWTKERQRDKTCKRQLCTNPSLFSGIDSSSLIWPELDFSDLIGFKCWPTPRRRARQPTNDFGDDLIATGIFLSNEVMRQTEKSNKLDFETCVHIGENIATPPISDISGFLTKCICNLILRPFFANIPKEILL